MHSVSAIFPSPLQPPLTMLCSLLRLTADVILSAQLLRASLAASALAIASWGTPSTQPQGVGNSGKVADASTNWTFFAISIGKPCHRFCVFGGAAVSSNDWTSPGKPAG
eukprot:1140914-Pelagomonas_calceolata.AAC.6